MAESHTGIDTEQFINEVKLRPSLWDLTSEEYMNKSKKSEVWADLCQAMFENFTKYEKERKSKTCKYLQKKWKNIRNCYTRELRRRKMSKFSENKNHKKYMYFDFLSFLQPHVQISTSPLPDDGKEGTETPPSRPAKRRKTEPPIPNNSLPPPRIPEPYPPSIEDDRLFLLSMVGDLANIHPDRKLHAKMELMSVILKFRNEYSVNGYYGNHSSAYYQPVENNKASRSPSPSSTPTSSTPSEASSDSE